MILILVTVAVDAAGVAVVVPFWIGVIMVNGKGRGVVDMIGLFWAVSVFKLSLSSILKRVETVS